MDDERPARSEPVFNAPWPAVALVGAIFAAYGLQIMIGVGDGLILRFGFAPADLDEGRLVTLISYQFLHGGLVHAAMNGLWCLAFAPPVSRLLGADALGAAALLLFYLVCGVLAALGYAVFNLHELGPPLVGASGAVAGLMGAGSRLLRGRPPAPLNDRLVLTMAAAFILLFVILGVIGFAPGMGPVAIAWQAHVVGYLGGLVLIGPAWRLLRRLRNRITSWRLDS